MNKTKKLLAMLLSILMLVSVLPAGLLTASAETNQATVTIENVSANPGSTVDVNVNISDNPGILGAVISLSYDSGLTLINATAGEAFSALSMTKPGQFKSPCQFTWDGLEISESDVKDGTILTLSFEVSEALEQGTKCNITISYTEGDIVDSDLNSLDLTIKNGGVNIIDYTPGDVDGNGKVNTTDVILLRRFIAGGYNVTINQNAANVNGDTKINMTDVIYMRRYIAGGYGVVLILSGDLHTHELEKTERIGATCTEQGNIAYWHCLSCGKYFSDANCVNQVTLENTVIAAKGHIETAYPYIAPTYDTEGLEGGSYCSVCGIVISERTVIPILEKNHYFIKYNINNEYLETKEIENSNPTSYTAEDGVAYLSNIQADGYVFEGWYDGPGSSATKITSIPVGTTGNKELYAHWTIREYTIQFDSPLAPVESKTYTVSQGATLSNPEWFGYTFVGWSDEDGNLVERIIPGTTGDITLHANWTSLRNQTIPVQSLGDPIIYEDSDNGQYLFAYELGRVENVPLFTIKSFGNTNGITITETTSTSGSISSTSASSIANMIAETTTRSDSWTLSEEWNESTTISQEHSSQVSSSVINTATQMHDETGKWSISSGSGGSTAITHSDGTSAKIGSKIGSSMGAGPYKVEAEISGELGTTTSDSSTNQRNWNTTSGYEGSVHNSASSSSSSSFGTTISDKSGYAQTKAHNKGTSETKTYAQSNTSSREYTSSLSYAESTTETTTRTYSNANAPSGFYRLVAAGTVHVFGVVGYDIATRSYYTFTYSIIDDEISDFVDYSKTTSQFDDYENGVLPFDVPYDINEYVDDVLYQSAGLVVDIDTGKVVSYTGEATSVFVPEYMPVDNGDGTTTVVKVTGFETNAFVNGKNSIKSIRFSKYVTEIPDNAFAGFDSLEKITAPAVTSIGDYAFSGCTSLNTINMPNVEILGCRAFDNCTAITEYAVSENVTEIGEKAFNRVNKITVKAYSSSVAESAIISGASQISITNVSDSAILENKIVVVPEGTEYFEFNGANKTYNNLRIVSEANTTVINNASLECTGGVPLKLSSESITLNRLTVSAPEYTMITSADTSTISLFGTINLNSSSTNSVLSRSIELFQANPQAVGKLIVSGNVLVCGEIVNRNLLTVTNGEVIDIEEDTYNSLASGSLDWVLESEAPLGATIVGEKWTYDLVSYTESGSSNLDGWTLYDTKRTSWDKKQGPVYSNPSNGVRNVTSEQYVSSTTTHYKYYHKYSSNYNGSAAWGSRSTASSWTEHNLDTTTKLTWKYSDLGIDFYGSSVCSKCGAKNMWIPDGSYTTNNYSTRWYYQEPVYTYYYTKTEARESSTEIIESDTNTNVQKWVQYVV